MDDCVLLPVSCCLTQVCVCVCDSFVRRLSVSMSRSISEQLSPTQHFCLPAFEQRDASVGHSSYPVRPSVSTASSCSHTQHLSKNS